MKSITFLVHNIYHYGGTTKSISNLANILAKKGHKITIISVVKLGSKPYYDLENSITVKSIFNYREISIQNFFDVLINRLNKYTPLFNPKILSKGEPNYQAFSSHIEKRMVNYLKKTETDILISTRASYNIIVANLNLDCIKIGMEHMFFESHNELLKQDIKNSYSKLDMITVLSDQDKLVYEGELPESDILLLPNIIDEHRENLTKVNLIISAGRLESEKGFDILIHAINNIKEFVRNKNYKFKLFGNGTEKEHLNKLIQKYRIQDIFNIEPTTNELSKQLSKSKITCVPSRVEGFGMVILEAMNQGSVVVSFDLGYGPSSLIKHGENGLLATPESIDDLSIQLKILMDNESHINTLKENAFDNLTHYSPEHIYHTFSKHLNEKFKL